MKSTAIKLFEGELGEVIDRRKGPRSDGGVVDRRSSNRRIAPRFKTYKGGRVVWPNGEFVECIIRNVSETGAGLEVHSPVPEVFDLVFEADQSRHLCRVVWQKPNRIGVKFE